MNEKTFETDCGKFFRSKFSKVNGYEENPEIHGKHPDFKIAPNNRNIYFEIYRPEASKIKEVKDQNKWKGKEIGKWKVKFTSYALSFNTIKAIVSLYIKEKKRKGQLPKDEPNFLVIDLSRRFQESIHISDLIFFEDDILDIFRILPTLSGVIFYGLMMDYAQKGLKLLYNNTTNNMLSEEERKIIDESLR